jgi:hypothetical protein
MGREILSLELEIVQPNALLEKLALVEPLDDDALAEAGLVSRRGPANPWDSQRMGGARWSARWDEDGWDGPCVRMGCRDFALQGAKAFEWMRIEGRLLRRVGAAMLGADDMDGEGLAFAAEYVACSAEEASAAVASRGAGGVAMAVLDFDGGEKALSIRQAWLLERSVPRGSAKKMGRL